MVKTAASLWSADLANLAPDIRRVDAYVDRYHLDVADGHYVPQLLFFPDLVRALRPHTQRPFEVHLMVTEPAAWIAPFVEAGAGTVIFAFDGARDPGTLLAAIQHAGCAAGVSLLITEPIEVLEPYWPMLDVVTVVGTAMGIKGAGLDPSIPGKIERLAARRRELGLAFEIQADGGIRHQTVPLLAAAGADSIVSGSLLFKQDPAEMTRWLASL